MQDSKGFIFFCYVKPDEARVRSYYELLKVLGFNPWMDVSDMPCGQKWREVIPNVIRNESSCVVVFLSRNWAKRRGVCYKELRIALDVAEEYHPNESFVYPVRLDDVEPPYIVQGFHIHDLPFSKAA